MNRALKELKTILPLLVLIFAFRSMAYEPYHIPSGSMKPTLQIGDFIMVEKFTYGLKVPFSDLLERPLYITRPALPERGDVIVFGSQRGPKINLIKRVIALPGDSVEIVDGRVKINDQFQPYDEAGELSGGDRIVYRSRTGKIGHNVQFSQGGGRLRNLSRIVVPEDKFFVLGDNRDNSSDSRVWGFVPLHDIKGKAKFVWMNFAYPWEPASKRLKLERIGTLI